MHKTHSRLPNLEGTSCTDVAPAVGYMNREREIQQRILNKVTRVRGGLIHPLLPRVLCLTYVSLPTQYLSYYDAIPKGTTVAAIS